MIMKTHIASVGPFVFLPISMLVYENIIELQSAWYYIVLLLGTLLGSLLPDIDEPGSYIGKRTPLFIPNVIKMIFGHRGITHTLPFIVLFYYISTILNGDISIFVFGIFLGVACHIAGDMLTKGGVRNFIYPITGKTTFGLLPYFLRFYTDSIIEKVFILPLFIFTNIGLVVFYLYLFGLL